MNSTNSRYFPAVVQRILKYFPVHLQKYSFTNKFFFSMLMCKLVIELDIYTSKNHQKLPDSNLMVMF